MTEGEYILLRAKVTDYAGHAAAIEAYKQDLERLNKCSEKGFTLHFVGVTSVLSMNLKDCQQIKDDIAELFRFRMQEHADQLAGIR